MSGRKVYKNMTQLEGVWRNWLSFHSIAERSRPFEIYTFFQKRLITYSSVLYICDMKSLSSVLSTDKAR